MGGCGNINCGHCSPTPPQAEWEKDFDKAFFPFGKKIEEYADGNIKVLTNEKRMKSFISRLLKAEYERGKADKEPLYEIPCSDGNHNSFWKSVVESPEWKAWYKEAERRFRDGKLDEKSGRWLGKNTYDVDECQECGIISYDHFASFMEYIREDAIEAKLKELLGKVRELLREPDCSENNKGECTVTCAYNSALYFVLALLTHPTKKK